MSQPVKESLEQKQKLVLHVGCGQIYPNRLHQRFRTEEWKEIRLDIDPVVKPDIVASILDMRPIVSESVDAVWSSQNLEHLYSHEVPVALAEFWRVLKSGGFVYITVPDIQYVAKIIAEDKLEEPFYVSNAGPISPIDTLYGFRPALAQGVHFMAHKTAFTATTLHKKLVEAHFQRVEVTKDRSNLWATGYKPESQISD